MKKNVNEDYESPEVIETTDIEIESVILKGSVVVEDKTEVVSTGQEVETHTLPEDYQHNWN